MVRRSLVAVFLILISATATLKSQTVGSNTIDVILAGYSAKIFTNNTCFRQSDRSGCQMRDESSEC